MQALSTMLGETTWIGETAKWAQQHIRLECLEHLNGYIPTKNKIQEQPTYKVIHSFIQYQGKRKIF
jgi:hypothetical protein